jgi:hypothetical protein
MLATCDSAWFDPTSRRVLPVRRETSPLRGPVRCRAFGVALVFSAVCACASFKDGGDTPAATQGSAGDAAPAGTEDGTDAATQVDDGAASPAADAVPPPESGDSGLDGGADAASQDDVNESGPPLGPTGLDPSLVLPSLTAPKCNGPGPFECAQQQACRLATPDSGRCDDCSRVGTCASPVGASCSVSEDCTDGAQCYASVCALVCVLSAPQCTPSTTCHGVGNIEWGVCR